MTGKRKPPVIRTNPNLPPAPPLQAPPLKASMASPVKVSVAPSAKVSAASPATGRFQSREAAVGRGTPGAVGGVTVMPQSSKVSVLPVPVPAPGPMSERSDEESASEAESAHGSNSTAVGRPAWGHEATNPPAAGSGGAVAPAAGAVGTVAPPARFGRAAFRLLSFRTLSFTSFGFGPAGPRVDRSAAADEVGQSEAAEAGNKATVIDFPERPGRRVRRNVWITAGAVVVVIAVIIAVVLFSPLLALKTVTIDGNKMVSTATIAKALAPLKNEPLPQVSQDQVRKLLAPLQQIRSVSVEARPPSTLLVHLVEREPVAVVKNQSKSGNGYVLVDQDGVQLGNVPDPAKISLPLIDGGTAVTGSSTFKAITAVLAALPQQVLARLQHASASSPDAVVLTLTDGKTVVWGNASDKELKAKVLQALLKAPAPLQQPGQSAPAQIQVYDVSAPRHPVTR